MRWLAALALVLPGCLVVQVEPSAQALDATVLSDLRPGRHPWTPDACDPTRATTRGSDTWVGWRDLLTQGEGEYLGVALGAPTTGEGRADWGFDPRGGTNHNFFSVTSWDTQTGVLLLRDGQALLYEDLDDGITPADVKELADRAVAGLALDLESLTGEGTFEIVALAPGADMESPYGWLRVGMPQYMHSPDQKDWQESENRVELDLRPWPTPEAHWISRESAQAIASAFLHCLKDVRRLPNGLESPSPTAWREEFRQGELVWRVGDELAWRDDRKMDCWDEGTWPRQVSLVVDARTGALLAHSVSPYGANGCVIYD